MAKLTGIGSFLVLGLAFGAPTTAADPFPAERLDELFAGYAETERLGFVALVARGDRVVFHEVYGPANRKKKGWRKDNLWAVIGNGGIVSTAEDMLRWAAAREELFPEPRAAAPLGTGRRASHGWYLRLRDVTGLQVFHGGAIDRGFIAMVRTYPERDTTLILLSNTFKGKKPHIRTHMDEIEDVLFAEVTAK